MGEGSTMSMPRLAQSLSQWFIHTVADRYLPGFWLSPYKCIQPLESQSGWESVRHQCTHSFTPGWSGLLPSLCVQMGFRKPLSRIFLWVIGARLVGDDRLSNRCFSSLGKPFPCKTCWHAPHFLSYCAQWPLCKGETLHLKNPITSKELSSV